MPDELISREAAVHVLCEENINRPLDSDRWLISDIYKKIEELPTIDAVPVVRCRDCKECEIDEVFHDYWCNGRKVWGDHYCAYGERRTDEQT